VKGRREAVFQEEFLEDLRFWVDTNRRVALRALDLVEAILRDPFQGLGKPEPLKYLGSGVWSRRLTEEHRDV
jgi:toxin YoeB